jgi:alkanesulfonate monooxygenase SsuD/methylene tetrahydromethanopterin reductase-like flavin-dependent oxidoreductase (luciferase family)
LDEAGHDRSQLHAQHHVRIFVDDNRERAQETAKAAIVRYDSSSAARGPRQPGGPTYAMDPEYDWSAMEQTGRNIYGTPDDCIAGVRRAREHYEFDEFSATFNFGGLTHEEIVSSMRLFAAEVMPALPEILEQPEPVSA